MTEREKSYAQLLYQPADPELAGNPCRVIRTLEQEASSSDQTAVNASARGEGEDGEIS
ncbi:MAG TPA: hypothetical protein H9700_08625 [Candidatus Eisenbergiella intestinipullorum]|nr:hypothetical protein [Candidatus Eisenbergiella intestinipullorum]